MTALPGDASQRRLIEEIIRVDQAGELAARIIYQGQLAVMPANHPDRPIIQHMLDQELAHLDRFNKYLVEREVRPTMLQPLWEVASFGLGVATALLGPKAAMACTEAVEEVIDGHYAEQREKLGQNEPELAATIDKFRADEIAHRDTARAHGAREAPAYPLLTAVIKAGCKAAITISKRV